MVHIENQKCTAINKAQLVENVQKMFSAGYRLVAITCTTTDSFELTYSFDKDYAFESFRFVLPKENPEIPSITGVYFAAFTYENELQDLFGIKVNDLALDFKGTFYKLSLKTPFAPQPPQQSVN
jgi:ech hydrogenase subunit D